MDIAIGQTVAGYEVLAVVGAGGMGTVYKVRNVISERIEAMKVVRPDAADQADSIERFIREIKLQARFQHPNIAVLHNAIKLDDQILMIMELVEGAPLNEWLRRGPIAVTQAVSYTSQCLRALEYAHHHGVIHRDIKPSNIIVSSQGVVKLVDFGIARALTDLTLTGAGMAIGSLHYMSPEQTQGSDLDARSDVYSMGVTLYEMLTGVRPFTGDNAGALMRACLERQPVPPLALNPSVPAALSNAVMRALEKNREARFHSAAEFCQAIESLVPAATRETITMPAGFDVSTTSTIANCLASQVGPIAFHLVKQASARAGNVRELCLAVAQQVPDESTRHRFLDRCEKELHLPPLALSKPAIASSPDIRTEAVTLDPEVLARVRKDLAIYLGPVAKVIVDRAARKSTTVDQLYDTLAGEIPSAAERAKFLASKP